MTYSLHASNGQQESASQGGDYVSAEEYRAMIDRAERSHADAAIKSCHDHPMVRCKPDNCCRSRAGASR
jgi:hypothetical protein